MYSVISKRAFKVIILALFLTALFVFEGFLYGNYNKTSVNTSEGRIKYIESLGIKVDSEKCKCEEITIPEKFSPVYLRYNLMQKTAGFDLSDYKGFTVNKFSCPVTDAKCEASVTLLIYAGKVIGGDVAQSQIDGFMVPLNKEEIKKVLTE